MPERQQQTPGEQISKTDPQPAARKAVENRLDQEHQADSEQIHAVEHTDEERTPAAHEDTEQAQGSSQQSGDQVEPPVPLEGVHKKRYGGQQGNHAGCQDEGIGKTGGNQETAQSADQI